MNYLSSFAVRSRAGCRPAAKPSTPSVAACRAKPSICLSVTRGSCLLIDRKRRREHVIAEMPAQRGRCVEIDRKVEPGGEFVLLAKEHEAGMPPWQILDEQIDIARRCETIPQHGAEECQAPDASLAAAFR